MAADIDQLQQEFKRAIDEDDSKRVIDLLTDHNPGIDAQIILPTRSISHDEPVLQAETLLHYAGRMGSKNVVEALIRRGALLENEFTALFLPDHPLGTLANPDLIARFKTVFDFAREQQGKAASDGRIRALKLVNDLQAAIKSFDQSIARFKPKTTGEDPVSGTIKGEREKMTAHLVWDELKRFSDDQTNVDSPKERSIEFLKRMALLPATIQLRLAFSKLQNFKDDKANAAKIEKIQVTPFGSETVLTGMPALQYFSQTLYSAMNGTNAVSPEIQQAILIKIDEIIAGEEQVIDFAKTPYCHLPVPEIHSLNIDEFLTRDHFKPTKQYQHRQSQMMSSSGESLSAQGGGSVLSTPHESPKDDSPVPDLITPQLLPGESVPSFKSGTDFSHGFIPSDEKLFPAPPRSLEKEGEDDSLLWGEREQILSPAPGEKPGGSTRKRPELEKKVKRKEKVLNPDDPDDSENEEDFLWTLAQRFFEDEAENGEADSDGRILGGAPSVDDEEGATVSWGVPLVTTLDPTAPLPANPLHGAPLLARPVPNGVNAAVGVGGMAGGGNIPPIIVHPHVGHAAPAPVVAPGGAIARVDASGVSSLYNAAHKVYQYLQKPDGHQHISLPAMRLFSTLTKFETDPQLKAVTLSNGKTIWQTLNPAEPGKFQVQSLVGTAAHPEGELGTAMQKHTQYQQQYTNLLAQVGGQYRPAGRKYYFQRTEEDLIEFIMLRADETLTTEEMREATHQLIVICQDVFDKVAVDVCVYDNPLFQTTAGLDLLKQTVITVASEGVALQKEDKAKPQDREIQKQACALKQKMVEPAPEFVDIGSQRKEFEAAETAMNWIGSTREETLQEKGIRLMTEKGRILPKISDTAQDEETTLRREYWTQVTQWERDQKDWGSIVSATDILLNVLTPLNADPNLYQKDGIYAHLMPLGEEGFKLFDKAVEEQRRALEEYERKKEALQSTSERQMHYSDGDADDCENREGNSSDSDENYFSQQDSEQHLSGSSDDEDCARDDEDCARDDEDLYFEDTGEPLDLDDSLNSMSSTTVILSLEEMGPSGEKRCEGSTTVHLSSRKQRAATVRRSPIWPSMVSSSDTQHNTGPFDDDRMISTYRFAQQSIPSEFKAEEESVPYVSEEVVVTLSEKQQEILAIEHSMISHEHAYGGRKHFEDGDAIDGYEFENVPEDGNCFYHALALQIEKVGLKLRDYPSAEDERHHFLRQQVGGPRAVPDEDIEEEDIYNAARRFNCVIAVMDTANIKSGFRYYDGTQEDKFQNPRKDELPADKKVVYLAYTGRHYKSVDKQPALNAAVSRTPIKIEQPYSSQNKSTFYHLPSLPPVTLQSGSRKKREQIVSKENTPSFT